MTRETGFGLQRQEFLVVDMSNASQILSGWDLDVADIVAAAPCYMRPRSTFSKALFLLCIEQAVGLPWL